MVTGLINIITTPSNQGINLAEWITAISTLAMAIIAGIALGSWKKELKYKHKAEFVTQAKLLLLCMDNFYGDGKIDDKIRKLTPVEKPYWQPLFKNEVDRYTEEVNSLYKNLLTQEAYIDGLKMNVDRDIIKEFLKTIDIYKDKLSNIATTKLNFCHTEDKMCQASFDIYEDNSKELVKIKKKAHELYNKIKISKE